MHNTKFFCAFLQAGPEQKQYKVKDRKFFEFKPEQLVSDIAHIYCYLGVSESFCRAVIGESRSFSPELFTQAACVLRKIGKSEEFLKRFEELAEKITVCKIFHYTCIYSFNIF